MIWLSVKRDLRMWNLLSFKITKFHLSPRSFFGGITLNPWIIGIFSLATLWIVGVVLALSNIGLWGIEDLKLTFYWAVGVAIVSLFESKENRAKFTGLSMIRDHLGAIAVIQTFVSIRTFPFLVELVLVPVSSILVMVAAFSKEKTKYRPAQKFSNGTLLVFGLFLLSWGLLALYNAPKDYLIDLTTNILLPTVLTIFFLPFLIGFYLFIGHEHTFRAISEIEGLGRLEKLRLFLLAFRPAGLNLEHIALLERQMRFHRPKNHSDVFEIIENYTHTLNVKSSIEAEQPHGIVSTEWLVQDARNWLIEFNLIPKFYEWLGFIWQAHDSVESRTQDAKTVLTYYIVGNRDRVTELELLLEVFGVQADSTLSRQFNDAAIELVKRANREDLDNSTVTRIKEGEAFHIELDQCTVIFSYTQFHSPAGIEAKLLIKPVAQVAETAGLDTLEFKS